MKENLAKFGKRILSKLPPSALKFGFKTLKTLFPVYLHFLKTTKHPVIVGPWTSEIGHELLYWIPFLEKLRNDNYLNPERTYIISRGDNSCWYRNITNNYYNIFQDISPSEYKKALTETRAGKPEKQYLVDSLDSKILSSALKHFGHDQYFLLHPLVMNNLLIPVWRGHLPVEFEEKYLLFRKFAPEIVDLGMEGFDLKSSKEYVAVKFHFSRNFPNTQKNNTFVREVIQTLSKRYKVLVLQLKHSVDNHDQPVIRGEENIIDCSQIPLATNLRVQTALVRSSKYLVTSLGGFSLLPVFLGVKSIAFYSNYFNDNHFGLLNRALTQLKSNGYSINDCRRFDLSNLP